MLASTLEQTLEEDDKQSAHLKQEEESDGVEVDRRLVADDGGDQVEKEHSEKTEQ
jgi:hypothetical protein